MEADREALVAYLAVHRNTGEFEVVPYPLVFVRRGATVPPLRAIDGYGALKGSLIERLEAATGIADIEAAAEGIYDEERPLPAIASSANADSRWALIALFSAGKDEDALVAFGFHMACALLMERPVERVKRGGLRSGQARWANANRRNQHAFRVARHLIETEPELAKNCAKLARRVGEDWLCFGHEAPRLDITANSLAGILGRELKTD